LARFEALVSRHQQNNQGTNEQKLSPDAYASH
jgi:hypothetical protein